jgi:hypothetical protein
MFDVSGYLDVANSNSVTIEKIAPYGTDLGLPQHSAPRPHFITVYHPSPRRARTAIDLSRPSPE